MIPPIYPTDINQLPTDCRTEIIQTLGTTATEQQLKRCPKFSIGYHILRLKIKSNKRIENEKVKSHIKK